jgi:peptide deformylase
MVPIINVHEFEKERNSQMEDKPIVAENDTVVATPPTPPAETPETLLKKKIIQVGNPLLEKVSTEVDRREFNPLVKDTLEKMDEQLGKVKGPNAGIAAIQLGIPLRIIGFWWGEEQKVFLLNPEISKRCDKMIQSTEGCLSVGHGNDHYTLPRHKWVKVDGWLPDGSLWTHKLHGKDAIVVQHEMDHLEGLLITRGVEER